MPPCPATCPGPQGPSSLTRGPPAVLLCAGTCGRGWCGGALSRPKRGTALRTDPRDTPSTLQPVDTSSPTALGLGTPGRMVPGCPRSPGVGGQGRQGAHRPGRACFPDSSPRPRAEPPQESGSPQTPRAVGAKGGDRVRYRGGWQVCPVARFPEGLFRGKSAAGAPAGPPGGSGAGTALLETRVVFPGGWGSATVSFLKEGRRRCSNV